MPITLTIADNGNGTGGVATIAGSPGGSSNELFRAQFQGAEGNLIWQSAGTRVGDGTIAFSVTPRNYWLWYVKSTNGTVVDVSELVHKAITDSTYLSVRTRAINAIYDRLRTMSFDELTVDDVIVLVATDEPLQKWPCVFIVRDAVPDTYVGGNNIRDDVSYPFQVCFQDRTDARSQTNVAKWDLWREKAERAFRNQRLPGVTENWSCILEPTMVLQEIPKVYQHVVSSFTVRVVSREVRGIQA